MLHSLRWLVLLLAAQTVSADVIEYVAADDGAFAWKVGEKSDAGYVNLQMTSQRWQGIEWQHTITVFRPTTVKHPDLAVLLITGGSFGGQQELMLGAMMANSLGVTMAVLWDIPNQPLFNGLKEDALIAHTFIKALETGDATWPLLFPMTKSAVRAMDALQAYSAEAYGQKIERFITTGASKRGWTTWFTAVVDERVCAIMPIVYDNLNISAQMQHQLDVWGAYSPMIDDYTKLGLQAKLASQEGQQLGVIVDPYTYKDRIKVPKLILNGTNDAYWTIDALNLYRDALLGPTYQLYVPNAGHGMDNPAALQRVLSGLGGFVKLIAEKAPLPSLAWLDTVEAGQAVLRVLAPQASQVVLWSTVAEGGRFGEAQWQETPMTASGEAWIGKVPLPASGTLALFGEATFDVEGRPLPLSTTLTLHTR